MTHAPRKDRADHAALVEERCQRRLNVVVNSECSCGGKGPNDPGVCPACMVWHKYRAQYEAEKGGGK